MLKKREVSARTPPGPGSSLAAKRVREKLFTIPGEQELRSDRNEKGRLTGPEEEAWGRSGRKGW